MLQMKGNLPDEACIFPLMFYFLEVITYIFAVSSSEKLKTAVLVTELKQQYTCKLGSSDFFERLKTLGSIQGIMRF